MTKIIINEYEPDVVSSPGETLLETIEFLGMSQAELAIRINRPLKTINEIIKGKTAITRDTAIQLEMALGVPASFWMNRQRHYDEYLARVSAKEELEKNIQWMKLFPVNEMIKLGWIDKHRDKVTQYRELLNFLGVVSPEAWENYQRKYQPSLRKSRKFDVDRYSLAAWLRKGELVAQRIECKPYNRVKFKDILNEIRKLTAMKPDIFLSKMMDICIESGVAFAIIPELPKIRVSGVAYWMTPEKAFIQLSLRYKTDDQFWFSFFHEAAHILQDLKRSVFVDDDKEGDSEIERDADRIAANLLIPPSEFNEFIIKHDFNEKAILRFARRLGIAPGIVVGQLQHRGYLGWHQFNELKRKMKFELSCA